MAGNGGAVELSVALALCPSSGNERSGSRSDFLLVSLFPAQRFPASDTAGLLILIIDRGIIKVAPARGRFQLRISVPPGTIGLVREKGERTEKERGEGRKKKKRGGEKEKEDGREADTSFPFLSFFFSSVTRLSFFPVSRGKANDPGTTCEDFSN